MLRPARNPHLQPIVDAVDAFLRANGMSASHLADKVYGRNQKGDIKISNLSPLYRGISRPSAQTCVLIKEKTGLDLVPAVLATRHVGKRPGRPPGSLNKRPPDPPLDHPTPAKTALAAFFSQPAPPSAPPPEPGPSVALTVTSPGGNIHIALTDVTLELAAQVLQSLLAASRR